MYTKPVTPVTNSLFNAQRSIQTLSKYVTKNIAKLKISNYWLMQLNDSSNITSLGAAASRRDPRKRQDHLLLHKKKT